VGSRWAAKGDWVGSLAAFPGVAKVFHLGGKVPLFFRKILQGTQQVLVARDLPSSNRLIPKTGEIGRGLLGSASRLLK
jgi:hypothetical protein